MQTTVLRTICCSCFVLFAACQVKSDDLEISAIRAVPTLQPETTKNKASTSIPASDYAPPTVDGSITSGEWDQAIVRKFKDGSELLILQLEKSLFLAIRASGSETITGNVYLAQDGKIEILHTSAALGTAIYEQQGDNWLLMQGFEWCCRGTMDSERARSERDQLHETTGWLGINSRLGEPNVLEYQIELHTTPIKMAVGFLSSSDVKNMLTWPPELDDDAIRPMPNGPPDVVNFHPDTWAIVEIND